MGRQVIAALDAAAIRTHEIPIVRLAQGDIFQLLGREVIEQSLLAGFEVVGIEPFGIAEALAVVAEHGTLLCQGEALHHLLCGLYRPHLPAFGVADVEPLVILIFGLHVDLPVCPAPHGRHHAGVEILGECLNFSCSRIIAEELVVILVGLLPRQDVQADVVERLARACHQQLFAVGRESCLHDKGLLLPQRIDRHRLQVEPIERLGREGHMGQIIMAGAIEQVATIGAHVVQVGGVMAKSELLEKATCQVIPPQEGAIAIAFDAIIGHQDSDEIGALLRPLLFAGEEQGLFVGREDKIALG